LGIVIKANLENLNLFCESLKDKPRSSDAEENVKKVPPCTRIGFISGANIQQKYF
jgi:hypothetical protein